MKKNLLVWGMLRKSETMKTKLIKFHFIILLILVVNLFIIEGYKFGLNSYTKITLIILLFGSGISMLTLNFEKRFFKILVKAYSTFYIAIAFLISSIIFTTDKHLTLVFPYDFYEPLLIHVPVYKQSDYEIYQYDKTNALSFLSGGGGIESGYYYVDKNYFIFKTRIGYFYFGNEYGEFIFPKPVIQNIKNIDVRKNSIYIDFSNDNTKVYKLESNN